MVARRHFIRTLLFALPTTVLYAEDARQAGTIYFARHAETVANATNHYNSATVDQLSSKGQSSLSALTEELRSLQIDEVRVSPMHRAMTTVLPYLQAAQRTATIWPELAECCYQRNRDVRPSTHLPRGGNITVPTGEEQWFLVEPGARTYDPANYADGLAQIRLAAERVLAEFGDSGKNVLLVGHSLAGSRLLELLTGRPPQGHLEIINAKVSSLQANVDGSFHLATLNGKPYQARS